MNFTPSKLSENFILNKLKSIKGGSLNLKNYNQEIKLFGESGGIVKGSLFFTVNSSAPRIFSFLKTLPASVNPEQLFRRIEKIENRISIFVNFIFF